MLFYLVSHLNQKNKKNSLHFINRNFLRYTIAIIISTRTITIFFFKLFNLVVISLRIFSLRLYYYISLNIIYYSLAYIYGTKFDIPNLDNYLNSNILHLFYHLLQLAHYL